MRYIVQRGEPWCLETHIMHSLSGSKDAVTMNVRTVDGIKPRQFIKIEIEEYDPLYRKYYDAGEVLADTVTGTLYNCVTGECLTSTQIALELK